VTLGAGKNLRSFSYKVAMKLTLQSPRRDDMRPLMSILIRSWLPVDTQVMRVIITK
jgi:hypothetical protein